jgi:ABC-type transport system involved in multi-copper enzyme maturation permease subunit
MSATRVRAIVCKELREYRRNRTILFTLALVPLIFMVQPLVQIFHLPAAAADTLRHKDPLLYMLGIPALAPALIASAAIVGERQQGTLEPVLATPIRRDEFILGKALAVLAPALVVSYAVFGLAVASVALFAAAPITAAVLRGSEVLAQVLFTPLICTWSIWVAMAISTRTSDFRAAQQLSTLASLPALIVSALIGFDVIHATPGLAVGLGVLLLVLDRLGWRIVSRLFDRERLITGTRS